MKNNQTVPPLQLINAIELVRRIHDYRYELCDCNDERICTPHQIVDGCLDIIIDMAEDAKGNV